MNGDRFQSMGSSPVRRGIPFSGRLIFGGVVLTLGLLWTAENLGLLDADSILRYWPALLLVYGFFRVIGAFGTKHAVSGVLFIIAGGWMLARELGFIQISIFRLWPVFLIFIGASLVWRSMRGESAPEGAQLDSYPRPFALMGGVVSTIESKDLVAIEASAVMGGVELDLRGAKSRGPQVVMEAFAWWGGIELIVPEDWRVVTEISPIIGGVEDKTRLDASEAVTTLVVRGFVIMGGIEIRNKRRKDGEFRGVHVGVKVGQSKPDASGDSHAREQDPRG